MKYPILRPDVDLIETNAGAIINKARENKFMFITYTQFDILRLCTGENSLEDIINVISQKYEVPREQVKHDVQNFISFMHKSNVIVVSKRELGNITKSKKFMKCKEEILNERKAISRFPTKFSQLSALWLILTERCPLECTYCNMALEAKFKPDDEVIMTTDDALKLLEEARALGAKILGISGGEITAYPNIFKVIRHAFDIGYQHVIFGTKAVGITKKFAERLYTSGARRIQISIDTLDPETYQKLIPNGTLESALRGIYNLIDAGFKIHVRSTITKYNIDQIPELWEFMYEIGAETIVGFVVYPEGRADRHLLPSKEQIKWLENTIRERFKDKKFVPEVSYFRCGIPVTCSAGILSIAAYPNGNVTLCDSGRTLMTKYPEKYVFGNFKYQSLREIWENSKTLNQFRESKFLPPCNECSYLYNCLRGCPIISEIVFGDPELADPRCIIRYPYSEDGTKRTPNDIFFWDTPRGESDAGVRN